MGMVEDLIAQLDALEDREVTVTVAQEKTDSTTRANDAANARARSRMFLYTGSTR